MSRKKGHKPLEIVVQNLLTPGKEIPKLLLLTPQEAMIVMERNLLLPVKEEDKYTPLGLRNRPDMLNDVIKQRWDRGFYKIDPRTVSEWGLSGQEVWLKYVEIDPKTGMTKKNPIIYAGATGNQALSGKGREVTGKVYDWFRIRRIDIYLDRENIGKKEREMPRGESGLPTSEQKR